MKTQIESLKTVIESLKGVERITGEDLGLEIGSILNTIKYLETLKGMEEFKAQNFIG